MQPTSKDDQGGWTWTFNRSKKGTGNERKTRNAIVIGSKKETWNEVRFKRTIREVSSTRQKLIPRKVPSVDLKPKEMKVGAGSFADIVKGSNPKRSIVVCDLPPPMVISIDNSDLLKLDEFGSAILVKVRDINLMENLNFILHREGFPTVNLRYVGGLWWGDSSSDDSDEDKISVADSFENMEVNPVEDVAKSDPFDLEGVIKGVGREESKASSSPSRPPGYAALKENGCPFTEADKGPCVQHSTGHEEVVVKEPSKGLNTEGGDISQVGESIQSVSSGCSKKEGLVLEGVRVGA
ncbi:hypothetical protein L1987_05654 [Smallanthus sonchifolius]|uniref:Uncharacterized protein n=1 Tax=Smallanthus sonchifolius TaxID=185202 RepID=A0ACB9JVY2_9ASTR|nr:hypothetical protein L1987_05654 [Smallanthus sonchifolius]